MSEQPTAYQVIQKCQEDRPISWEEYCVGASRTVSDKFYDDQVPLSIARKIMSNFSNQGEELDKLKKALFYGKNTSVLTKDYLTEYTRLYEKWNCKVPAYQIHAILGIATEAVELVQALLTALENNTELDMPNIYEEVGDINWYFALLMSTSTEKTQLFNSILRVNLLKLSARFPNKFTQDDAINRDLAVERIILEQTK